MDKCGLLTKEHDSILSALEKLLESLPVTQTTVNEYICDGFQEDIDFLLFSSNIDLLDDSDQEKFFLLMWEKLILTSELDLMLNIVRNVVMSNQISSIMTKERFNFIRNNVKHLLPLVVKLVVKEEDEMRKGRTIGSLLLFVDVVGRECIKPLVAFIAICTTVSADTAHDLYTKMNRTGLMGTYLSFKVLVADTETVKTLCGSSDISNVFEVNPASVSKICRTEAFKMVVSTITETLIGENDGLPTDFADGCEYNQDDNIILYIREYIGSISSFGSIVETLSHVIIGGGECVNGDVLRDFVVSLSGNQKDTSSVFKQTLRAMIVADSVVQRGETAGCKLFGECARLFKNPPINTDSRWGAALLLCCTTRALLPPGPDPLIKNMQAQIHTLLSGITKALKVGDSTGAIVADCVYSRISHTDTGMLLSVLGVDPPPDKPKDSEKLSDVGEQKLSSFPVPFSGISAVEDEGNTSTKLKTTFIGSTPINTIEDTASSVIGVLRHLSELSFHSIKCFSPLASSPLIPPIHSLAVDCDSKATTQTDSKLTSRHISNSSPKQMTLLEELGDIDTTLTTPFTQCHDPNLFDDICPFPTPLYVQDVINLLQRSPTEEHYLQAAEMALATLPGILFSGLESTTATALARLSSNMDSAPGLMTHGEELLETVANLYVPSQLHPMRRLNTALVGLARPMSLGTALAGLVHKQSLNVGVRLEALSSLSLCAQLVKARGYPLPFGLWLRSLRGIERRGGVMSLLSRYTPHVYDISEQGEPTGTISFRETPQRESIGAILRHKELGPAVLDVASDIVREARALGAFSEVAKPAAALITFHLKETPRTHHTSLLRLCTELVEASTDMSMLLTAFSSEILKVGDGNMLTDNKPKQREEEEGTLSKIIREIQQAREAMVLSVCPDDRKTFEHTLDLERGFDVVIAITNFANQVAQHGTAAERTQVAAFSQALKRAAPSIGATLLAGVVSLASSVK